jgi:ABC-type transport system involved in multi-copper enzyme maturation permease subunit
MTTTTADVNLPALPPATGRAGLRGVLASEFTKLRSVRSTYWTLAALIIVSVGIAAIAGFGIASNIHNNPQNKPGTDATQASLIAFFELGQLIIAVIGAMCITSEYSTGMIRTSMTAMPGRGTIYLAKLIVLTTVALVVSMVTSFISFFVGQAAMSGSGVSASLFHSITIPANAIAGAITSAIGLMFVLPVIIQLLPDNWRWDIVRFFPDAAGRVLSVTVGPSNPHLWSAWPQFLVTVIWAVVIVGTGGYLFRKRDA